MRFLRLALSALVLLFGGSTAFAVAHPLGNFTTNHLSRLTFSARAIDVVYTLDLAEIRTAGVDREIAADGAPTRAAYQTWANAHALEIAPLLELRVDGRPVTLVPQRTAIATRPGAAGLHTIYLTAAFRATLPAGYVNVAYHDRTEPGRLGWKDVVVTPATEPTQALTRYPSELIGSPRARLGVAVAYSAAGGARVVADSAADVPDTATPSAARMDDLAAVLARDGSGPLFLLGAFLLAIGLGALHALEPGHGKTLLAISLVGARATVSQAFILAASLTVAHTIGVLALGAIVLFATRWIVPEDVYPWITLLSGVLVAVVGARALANEIRRRRPVAHEHLHVHAAAQPHVHDHAHGLGAGEHHGEHVGHTHAALAARAFASYHEDHAGAHGHPHAAGDAHEHAGHGHDHADLDDEAHARAHAIPGQAPLTFKTAVFAAASGNIAPCPAALVVLLAAISIHRIAFGMALIVAFSVGLAATLTILGIAVVQSAAWLAQRPQFAAVSRWAPLASASVIAVIGAVMIGEGLVAQGVPSSIPVVAGLILIAIVGYAFRLPHAHGTARSVAA